MKKAVVYLIALTLGLLFIAPYPVSAQRMDTNRRPSATLTPRPVVDKPVHTVAGRGVFPDLVVVKFVERATVRLREERLVNLADEEDLEPVSALLDRFPLVRVDRLFTRPEAELEADRERGQTQSGDELADLSNYYMFTLDGRVNASDFIDALNAMTIVEIAYFEPIPEPAMPSDIAPPTPFFVPKQDYLDDAPVGIGVLHAWSAPGGRGDGVMIVDVEGGWQIGHEDLDLVASDLLIGSNSTDPKWRNHGTASLGVMIGFNNLYGITGIASDAQVGMVGFLTLGPAGTPGVANAINLAAFTLFPGDIVLVEVQTDFLPVEGWPAPRSAIKAAVATGIIVVAAAGNAGMDLDNTVIVGSVLELGGDFDTGSIMVGAASSELPHNPLTASNYGTRVTSYAWGENILTTGYGDAFDGAQLGPDPNQYYTSDFSNTSGAAAIVAGAVAAVQGVFLAKHGGPIISSHLMRFWLNVTGTPQGHSPNNHIGTMPNLEKIVKQVQNFKGLKFPKIPVKRR